MRRLSSSLFALLGLLACAAMADPLRVVTSNTLLSDLTRQIALPSDGVTCLLPLGADPHGYQPSPKDIERLQSAQVIVVNGLGLEPWLERLAKDLANDGRQLVVAAREADLLHGEVACTEHDHSHEAGDIDPHAWHDLRNTARYVAAIRDGLTQANPDSKADYEARAAALIVRIQALDTEARTRMAALPAERRRLVTSHDSFAYFGRAYGLEVIPIAGLRPDREPSARQLARLVDQIRALGVRAVFIESTSNPKIPRLLAEEAGVTVVTELYTDSLGPQGSTADTFLGMFRANLDTIEQSLKR